MFSDAQLNTFIYIYSQSPIRYYSKVWTKILIIAILHNQKKETRSLEAYWSSLGSCFGKDTNFEGLPSISIWML